MKIYRVGGSVRDELSGRPYKDRDYVVFGASEAEFLQRFPRAKKVGGRACVYIVRGDEYTLSDAADIASDLLLRDLTINAMARDENNQLLTHPLALSDLQSKTLRPVSTTNFFNDPLRVFRGARFAACLPDFKIHPSLPDAMSQVGERGGLDNIAAERVGNETLRACAGERPGNFLRLISKTGCLKPWFLEMADAAGIPAGPVPFHNESVADHLSQVMDILSGSPLRVWMALCHDLGKTGTDPALWPSHHHHDRIGREAALNLGRRLRLPRRFITAGAASARWHMAAGNYNRLRVTTKVNLLLQLHKLSLVDEMFALAVADQKPAVRSQAKADLEILLAVKLPRKHFGQGSRSGEILHQLRCEAMAGRGTIGN
jgi:tRNA nucleotidyltransferase (CCA-adding enzyme)